MAGWYFKKGKPKKVFPAKYNIRPKVRSSTQTPVARVLADNVKELQDKGATKRRVSYLFRGKVHEFEEEVGGEGSSVLYRDHIKSSGGVQHKDVHTHPKFQQQHTTPITIFGEYAHTPRSERPPIVNAIYDRIEVKLEQMNWRRQAFKYWNHIVPVNERFRKLFYFFSGNEGFFVERDYVMQRIRMSRDYEHSTAGLLIRREQWERISWTSVERTAPVDPPD